jgi:hypothetical protein
MMHSITIRSFEKQVPHVHPDLRLSTPRGAANPHPGNLSRSLRPSDFGSIDGCSIQVIANLEAALKAFRREILSSPDEDIVDVDGISKQLEKVAINDSPSASTFYGSMLYD